MIYAVIDTETTGTRRAYNASSKNLAFSKSSEIIQVSAILMDSAFCITGAFSCYCDAISTMSNLEAYRTHQIRMSDVRASVPMQFFSRVADQHLGVLFSKDIMFIGKNVSFDMDMIGAGCRDCVHSWVPPKPTSNIKEKSGRFYFDVSTIYKNRLSSYKEEFAAERELFFKRNMGLEVWSNAPEMHKERRHKYHDAYYDVVNTYLLFERIRATTSGGGVAYGR